MAENIKLPSKSLRAVALKTGKGWRLTAPTGKTHKAELLQTFYTSGDRFAVFRIVK